MKRGVDPRRPVLGSMDWFRKRLVASTEALSRGGLRAFSPRVALASACLRGPQRTPFVAKPLAIITW